MKLHYQYYQPKPDAHGRNMVMLGIDKPTDWTYCEVYNGEVVTDSNVLSLSTDPNDFPVNNTLEEIFAIHNRDNRPRGREIRSMSVGDIVVIHGEVWLVESIGFKKLEGADIPKFDDDPIRP